MPVLYITIHECTEKHGLHSTAAAGCSVVIPSQTPYPLHISSQAPHISSQTADDTSVYWRGLRGSAAGAPGLGVLAAF